MVQAVSLIVLGVVALLWAAPRVRLSLAKHPSLAGHPRLALRAAALLPGYSYDETTFFRSDGAPEAVAAKRYEGLHRLAGSLACRHTQTIALTRDARAGISDLQFTHTYRVPFQYSAYVRKHLPLGGFVTSSEGVQVIDVDGQRFYDVTGSYGVNVFGYDVYKRCIDEAVARARPLGPVLGSLHSSVAWNVAKLKEISGLDEVSFHMSGTEAVMQAVRLARYHTGRKYLVRFTGAYHGWWGDVQPGPGNPLQPEHTYTLRDMDPRTLRVLRSRRDIACVLVNPLQALHPNAGAPGDGTLIDSGRGAHFDREAYAQWLEALRRVCDDRDIVLIFDEVFVGFRIAPGGAQEYFGVNADMVTYGKTVGGGLPVGVVCGKATLMKRYREDRPADICFARGTFNSHPYVMTAMQVFLERLATPAVESLYRDLDAVWNARAADLNRRLTDAGVPVRVANLSTIWTVLYTEPSRYNWLLQFYLREHGVALSWVGTGRLIFSLDYSDADFAAVRDRFVAAARAMHADGWWWHGAALTNRAIRRRVLRETVGRLLGRSQASSSGAGVVHGVDQLSAREVQRRAPVQ